MTKKEIISALSEVAPNISINTKWSNDEYAWDEFDSIDAFEGEDRSDWQPWTSCVSATAIDQGEISAGESYLGGNWEKYGDNPEEINPMISGYFPQMVEEALQELLSERSEAGRFVPNVEAAISKVKEIMTALYEEQQAA